MFLTESGIWSLVIFWLHERDILALPFSHANEKCAHQRHETSSTKIESEMDDVQNRCVSLLFDLVSTCLQIVFPTSLIVSLRPVSSFLASGSCLYSLSFYSSNMFYSRNSRVSVFPFETCLCCARK